MHPKRVHRKQMRLVQAVDLVPVKVYPHGRVILPQPQELAKNAKEHGASKQLPDVRLEDVDGDDVEFPEPVLDSFDHAAIEEFKDVCGRIEQARSGQVRKDSIPQSEGQLQPEVAVLPRESPPSMETKVNPQSRGTPVVGPTVVDVPGKETHPCRCLNPP